MSRVLGRTRSSSADSDGTPEKMITGTSAATDTTTSRPDPRLKPQIDDRRGEPWFARSASSPSSAVSAETTENPCISRNFTSGRRTEMSSSTTSTRRAASFVMPPNSIMNVRAADSRSHRCPRRTW